jgi:membrane protein implicated in regulation of membrane protease activity
MSYGSNGSLVVSNTTFWLIPLKLVLAGVVVLLVLIALIIVIKRHLDHRNSSEKKRIAELEDQVRQLSNRSSDVTQTAPPHSDVQS